MTVASPEAWSPSDADAVRRQLHRILNSAVFLSSQRRQRFLRFLVDETLAGRGDRLKGYAVAVAVFDRPASFDPALDPVVRIEAGRLRDKLREYYATEGRDDPVHIELPKGSYTPHIDVRQVGTSAEASATTQRPADQSDAPASAWSDGAGLYEKARLAYRSQPAWFAAAIVLVAMAGVGLWSLGSRPAHTPSSDKPSIAVLPFDNIGGDARWARLADGVTEDVITDLSHAKDLIVIARNSTQPYKNKPVDVRHIGRSLAVKYVLEGSIQPIGERIRVTAQLIETAAGSHVWAERYDRPASDLFAVQSELTQRIAATLISYQGAVAEAERTKVKRKSPANLTAYETYLLGIEAKHQVTKDSLTEAERLFRKAIELDPQFARAYCGLATVQYYRIDLGLAPSVSEAVRAMTQAAQQAVRLDPDDGLTHQVLGLAYGYQGKPEQSLAEFNRAEALAPSDADLLIAIAWSLPTLGEAQRAVAMAERALLLNPHYPDWYNQGLSFIYYFGERYEQSVKYRLLVKQPLAVDVAFLAMAHAQLGHSDAAKAAVIRLQALDAGWNAEQYLSQAGGFADAAAELFVDGARKAGISDCVTVDVLNGTPAFMRVPSCDRQRASAHAGTSD